MQLTYFVNRFLFRSLEFGSLELDAKQEMLSAQLALSSVDTGRQAPTLPAALFESHIALDAQTVPQERALQMLMKRMNGGQLQLLSHLDSFEKSMHEVFTVTKVTGRFCNYESEYLTYTSDYKRVMRNQNNRQVNHGRYDNHWLSIRLAEPISTRISGKQEYSFRFSRTGNNNAPLVGIAVIDSASLQCGAINSVFHRKPKSWIYNNNGGMLYKMGNNLQYCLAQVPPNGVLRIRVDLLRRNLAFYSNDINCGNIYLEINDDDLKKTYIVVDIFSLGDFVDIL